MGKDTSFNVFEFKLKIYWWVGNTNHEITVFRLLESFFVFMDIHDAILMYKNNLKFKRKAIHKIEDQRNSVNLNQINSPVTAVAAGHPYCDDT